MSNNFQGYLLKALKNNVVFPHQYIAFKTWKSTPNQREELKAYRDDNTRNLTRITAAGKKSVFSFTIRGPIHLEDKIIIQDWFYNNEETADHEQRKIHLSYWNDEINNYKPGWFYRPNLTFPIIRIEDDDIIYDEIQLDFVEY